ncbi:MAG: hypothetical protein JWM98_1698 [Thermoleophilia bacterium]|nr:hypothetical protein [Thermoleophilia bacterium]
MTTIAPVAPVSLPPLSAGGPAAPSSSCCCGSAGASAQAVAGTEALGAKGAPEPAAAAPSAPSAPTAAAPPVAGAPVADTKLPGAMSPDPRKFRTADPASIKDQVPTKGLKAPALGGLDEAHRFGLRLIEGYADRNIAGTNRKSDHASGLGIDVTNGNRPTDQTKAYAEYMRQAGKQGLLGVKYVIHNDQIASGPDFAWKPYHSSGGNDATQRHLDHVHVSFN